MQYQSFYQFCNLPKQTFRITIDYYSILEIPNTADQNQIRIAYVKQASRYHPDSPQRDQTKYSLVREAFAVLADEKLKFQYDTAMKSTNTFKEEPKNEFHNLSDKTDTELEINFTIGEIKYPMTIKVPTQINPSKERLEELATYHMRKFIEIDGGFSKRFSGTLFQVNRGLGWVVQILRLIAKKK